MNTLYILCGLPGSGKSTWAKGMVNSKIVTVSRDVFRVSLFCGNYTFDKDMEPIIKASIHEMVSQLLMGEYSVIIDETNLTREKRNEWINKARLHGGKPVIVHFKETSDCLENRMREPRGQSREKWETIINGMKMSFQEPTESEAELITILPFNKKDDK